MTSKTSAKPGELPPLPFHAEPLPVGEAVERFDAWAWVEWDEAVAALNGEPIRPPPRSQLLGRIAEAVREAERGET